MLWLYNDMPICYTLLSGQTPESKDKLGFQHLLRLADYCRGIIENSMIAAAGDLFKKLYDELIIVFRKIIESKRRDITTIRDLAIWPGVICH